MKKEQRPPLDEVRNHYTISRDVSHQLVQRLCVLAKKDANLLSEEQLVKLWGQFEAASAFAESKVFMTKTKQQQVITSLHPNADRDLQDQLEKLSASLQKSADLLEAIFCPNAPYASLTIGAIGMEPSNHFHLLNSGQRVLSDLKISVSTLAKSFVRKSGKNVSGLAFSVICLAEAWKEIVGKLPSTQPFRNEKSNATGDRAGPFVTFVSEFYRQTAPDIVLPSDLGSFIHRALQEHKRRPNSKNSKLPT